MSNTSLPQSPPHEPQPVDPRRVRQFAEFFKRYMSLSSLVVAALPIPVTAIGLIPTYQAQTKFLATYASMLCFLMLGFIFSIRHAVARTFFPQVVQQGMLMRSTSVVQPVKILGNSNSNAFSLDSDIQLAEEQARQEEEWARQHEALARQIDEELEQRA